MALPWVHDNLACKQPFLSMNLGKSDYFQWKSQISLMLLYCSKCLQYSKTKFLLLFRWNWTFVSREAALVGVFDSAKVGR